MHDDALPHSLLGIPIHRRLRTICLAIKGVEVEVFVRPEAGQRRGDEGRRRRYSVQGRKERWDDLLDISFSLLLLYLSVSPSS